MILLTLKTDQTGRRDAFAQLDEAVKGDRQLHQRGLFLSPDIRDRARQRAMSGLAPQPEATLFQPSIQRSKVGEVRHALQHLMTGVPDVLLDLAFLPSRSRIAELGLVNIVVRHGEKAHVDLPFLATADPIHCRLRSAWPRTHGGQASLS